MINCKIGLISVSGKYMLSLGVFRSKPKEKTVRELYNNLQFLYPFSATLYPNGKVIPSNGEDFRIIRERYQLKGCIKLLTKYPDNRIIIRTEPPVLYDLTCNVPLFPPRTTVLGKYENVYKSVGCKRCFIFIVIPEIDPFIRGKIIDNCLSIPKSSDTYMFMNLGCKEGLNKISTSKLASRYLYYLGAPTESIIENTENMKFPECIMESFCLLSMVNKHNPVYYIAVRNSRISLCLSYIRQIQKTKRVLFIGDH